MLRGRKVTPSASPYARPEASPSAPQLGSPRWLSGLISGAGKLISSVLPVYRSSASPSSSSYSSSDEDDGSSDDDVDEAGLQRLDQRGNGFTVVNKCLDGQLAIVPKSEAKLAIEQLLVKETFSRDECDRLTKLIQSRVVDFPSSEAFGNETEGLKRRLTGNDSRPQAFPSFGQKRAPLESVFYSSRKQDAFSPGSSLFEACTPDICNKAVLEAKKWFEQKKLESKPKYDSECGPCTLNTDMLQYDIESEGGSPVDMAKSYMRSLPPWRSPSLGGIGFRTPPPSGIRRYKDEASYESISNYLASSKQGLKRDRLFLGAWDTLDESRSVRLKSTSDNLETSMSKQIESSPRLSEHEGCKSLSGSDKRASLFEDQCTDGAYRLADKKDANTNHPLETGNIDSTEIILESEEVIGAELSTHGISAVDNPPEPTKSLDEDQPSQTAKEVDNVSVPCDALASASRLVEQDENPPPEINVFSEKHVKLAVPKDASDAVNLNDVQTFDMQTNTVAERTAHSPSHSSGLDPTSGTAETNCSFDSRPQDGNSHLPMEANGSINASSTNGSFVGVNTKFNHETVTKGADTVVPQNGTRMRSIERMLNEPLATTSRRGKRVVSKSRRGRKT